MMRPMLTLLMAKLCGKIEESTYYAAISLELLHTASLVHDDVVDESDKRRGQASVNALYDNKVSVLVGDFLLATSLTNAALTDNISLVKLVSCLGQKLSEGEIIQLSNTNASDFSEDVYFDVIKKKTAALFSTAAEAGVRSVESCDETAEKAYRFGELIGIAFQIKDDILDYAGTASVGKPLGVDILEQKITMPLLGALASVSDEEAARVRGLVKDIVGNPEYRDEIVDFVKDNGGLEAARAELDAYVEEAVKALDVLPDCFEKECLVELAYFTAKRIM